MFIWITMFSVNLGVVVDCGIYGPFKFAHLFNKSTHNSMKCSIVILPAFAVSI